ncbi:MAG TPA: DUF1698 domain-containing protein [Kiritimatiellae bacterium]|nr:DUF1698 domain-containing protein [Kiritimatiellia bacterium]
MKQVARKLLRKLGYEIYSINKEKAAAGDGVTELCRTLDLPILEPPSRGEFQARCSPLFPPASTIPSDALAGFSLGCEALVRDGSMQQYFQMECRDGDLVITDDYPESHYYSRQRMLETIYGGLLGGLSGKSVLDIGCSSGYYSFFCARQGAERVVGIDARPEHERQFSLLRRALALESVASYRNLDMEYGLERLEPDFDVVLAQGVIYHVYDHPRFLRNLHRLTRGWLVLEGACSGRTDYLCKAELEDTSNLRASIHGPVLYPSLPWLVRLLRWTGFDALHYIRLPSDIEDRWGYGKFWRVMLACRKSDR